MFTCCHHQCQPYDMVLGVPTLKSLPEGMTSLKNFLNFSALLPLPCEDGKAMPRASCTAPTFGAVAATFRNRSAFTIYISPPSVAHNNNNNTSASYYMVQQMLHVCGTSLVLPGWLVLGVMVGTCECFACK